MSSFTAAAIVIECLLCSWLSPSILILFSEDQGWYRARVMEVQGDLFKVQYIDFGNYDLINAGEMLPLPAQFEDGCALTFPCRLSGESELSVSRSKKGRWRGQEIWHVYCSNWVSHVVLNISFYNLFPTFPPPHPPFQTPSPFPKSFISCAPFLIPFPIPNYP